MCTGHELVKHGASPLKSVWHITAPKNLVDLSISRNSTVFILICITLNLKLSTFLCHVPACVTKQSRTLVGWEKRYTTLTYREHYYYFKKESASTKWTHCITVYIKTNPFVATTEMEITFEKHKHFKDPSKKGRFATPSNVVTIFTGLYNFRLKSQRGVYEYHNLPGRKYSLIHLSSKCILPFSCRIPETGQHFTSKFIITRTSRTYNCVTSHNLLYVSGMM